MEERDLIIGIDIGKEKLQISCQRGLVEGESIENIDIKGKEPAKIYELICDILADLGIKDVEKETRMLVLTAEEIDPEKNKLLGELKGVYFATVPDIRVIKEKEALYHYVINQPRELKGFEVLVIDFIGEELKILRAVTEKGRKPLPVIIEDEDDEGLVRPNDDMTGEQRERSLAVLDAELSVLCDRILKEHIVTGIYLLGEVFEAGWYGLTRDVLVKNRRVFVGSNLYSRGACLYASDILYDAEKAAGYLYISEDILKCNVGIKVRREGAEVTEFVIEGGRAYRDLSAEFTFVPEHDMVLPIVIRPIRGEITDRVVPLPIPKEKDRDPKSMCFKCTLDFLSDKELNVIVEDIGMGEFYPASGKKYKEVITL